MVPLIVDAPDPAASLAAYASLYLEQEVQAEGLVLNVGTFARFLEAVSFSHASVLNISNVAREAQASRMPVEGYLEILEKQQRWMVDKDRACPPPHPSSQRQPGKSHYGTVRSTRQLPGTYGRVVLSRSSVLLFGGQEQKLRHRATREKV